MAQAAVPGRLTPRERRDWYVHLGMRALPMDACSAIGGWLVPKAMVSPVMRGRAIRLFQALRPELASEPNAYEAMADRLADHIGRMMAEFSVSHRLIRAGRSPIAGEDHLAEAAKLGRPLIFLFLHLGNFELSGMQVAYRFPGRVKVLVAPPADPVLAAIAMETRARAPLEVFVKSPTVWRQALAHLRTPGAIFMLSGDETVDERVQAPAFGRPFALNGNLGKTVRLAMNTGAAVVPFYNERLGGARFRTHVLPHLDIAGDPRDREGVLAEVRRLDAIVDGLVRRHLDQWYMAYDFEF